MRTTRKMAKMVREVSGEKLWVQLVIIIHCQICNEMKSSTAEASSCTVGDLKFLRKKLLKIHKGTLAKMSVHHSAHQTLSTHGHHNLTTYQGGQMSEF